MNNIFVLLKTRTMKLTLARRKTEESDKWKEQKASKNVLQSTGVERKWSLGNTVSFKGGDSLEIFVGKNKLSSSKSSGDRQLHTPKTHPAYWRALPFCSLADGSHLKLIPPFYLSTGCKYLTIPLHWRNGKIMCRSSGDRTSFSG